MFFLFHFTFIMGNLISPGNICITKVPILFGSDCERKRRVRDIIILDFLLAVHLIELTSLLMFGVEANELIFIISEFIFFPLKYKNRNIYKNR
jgi:hypothetical protein